LDGVELRDARQVDDQGFGFLAPVPSGTARNCGIVPAEKTLR
jgi:hypothetical protein